jgi:hypothetical protein
MDDELLLQALESAAYDGTVETADGCIVEPDGVCPHGEYSPLILAGCI